MVRALCFALQLAGFVAVIVGAAAWVATGDGAAWWIRALLDAGVTAHWALTPTVDHAQMVLGSGALCFVIGVILDKKPPTESVSHGSARFATTAELRRCRCLDRPGQAATH
jgi:hypothetical protein